MTETRAFHRSALLLALCAAACGTPRGDRTGERWYLEDTSDSMAAEGTRTSRLLRDRRLGVDIVDEGIVEHRFYEPDCIVYNTIARGRQIVAVCGDRTPLAIAGVAPPFEWEFEDDGLAMVGPVVMHEGRPVHLVERLPIDTVFALARIQPEFRAGWTGNPIMDLFYPPIRPVTEVREPPR